MSEDETSGVVVGVLVTLAVIFSVNLTVVFHFVSSHGAFTPSIYLADIAVVAMALFYVSDCYKTGDWGLRIVYRRTTALMICTWLLILTSIALASDPSPSFISVLWALKWFEALAFFLLIQQQRVFDVRSTIGVVLPLSAFLLSVLAIHDNLTTNSIRYRADLFPGLLYNNPNFIATFLILGILMTTAFLIRSDRPRRKVGLLLFTGVLFAGVLTTGSRSGVVALLAGGGVLVVLLRREIAIRDVAVSTVLLLVSIGGFSTVSSGRSIHRLLVAAENISNPMQIRSIRFRVQHVSEAADLFVQAPVFGHGWMTVPYQVGVIDVFYATILVDLGLVGGVVIASFYASILLDFLRRYHSQRDTFAAVGGAWTCALLIQSLTGNYLRIPQIMFLLFLVIAGVNIIERERI
jgi:O-antigen ligase